MLGPFSSYTGRNVKVAIIDSGINPRHPHVGAVAGGVRLSADGGESATDYLDYNGHGTAVAGAVREKAPDALLYAVKVFDRTLTTTIEVIIRAIEWAVDNDVAVINLSLGTNNEAHREKLQRVVEAATDKNIAIVSARQDESGGPLLPGCLPPVIGVTPDPECPRDGYMAHAHCDCAFVASPYPREVPGVPRERNLNGVSFAVANMAGFVARAREMSSDASVLSLRNLLRQVH